MLQLSQQLEATFARLIVVAVGENDLLRSMLDASVFGARARRNARAPSGSRCSARSFRASRIRCFSAGRLLMQANARSTVLHADASLQQQPPSQGATLG